MKVTKKCLSKVFRKVPNIKFDKRQVKAGIKVELEHTRSRKIAKVIAEHHLAESPLYYKALKKMEKRLKI